MKMSRYIIYAVLITLISSCDYYGKYEFRIENELNVPLTVSFKNRELWDSLTIIVVPPDSIVIAAIAGSENLGMNEELHGIYSDTVKVFKDLSILVGTKKLNKDFQLGNEWHYELIEKQYGVYTLRIDSTDLY